MQVSTAINSQVFLSITRVTYNYWKYGRMCTVTNCSVLHIIFALCSGGNLSEMLVVEDDIKEALPLDQSLYYIEQILQGVHFLHQNSVLHLDIKGLYIIL